MHFSAIVSSFVWETYGKDRLKSSGELFWSILVLQLSDLLTGEPKNLYSYDFGVFVDVSAAPKNNYFYLWRHQDT